MALSDAGLEVLRVSAETIRRDRGQPVAGLLFIARRPEGVDGLEVSEIDMGTEVPFALLN